jgi:hypothetical protein
LVLTLALGISLVACGKEEAPATEEPAAETTEATVEEPAAEATEEAATEEPANEDAAGDVMSYADFVAADLDTEVVVETYVQAKQSWWEDKATIYTQNEDGAFFIYEMACSEDDYAKLTEGTKIKVTGVKSEWSGEVEIVDATFEIEDGNYVATATDVTDLLGKDELIEKQNQLVSFTDLTVKSVAFKNDQPGDDIYVTFEKDGNELSACLEYYLNGSDEEFYNLVSGLEEGATVDVEGFLYWYEGANPHITKVTVK